MKTTVVIRFVSGREEKYEMELWEVNKINERLTAFATSPAFIFRTTEDVVVIPTASIERFSIKIPKHDSRVDLSEIRLATPAK